MKKNSEGEGKRKNIQLPETDDLHRGIHLQIQIVIKETAKLIGLLEGGLQGAGIDSPEHESLRKFGTTFLNELVRVAKGLDVQLH